MGQKIGIIGVGNLGKSIINGFLKSKKINNKNINILLRNKNNKNWTESSINIFEEKHFFLKESSIIIIAVKPYQLSNLLEEIKDYIDIKKHIILSTVSGVYLEEYYKYLDTNTPLFRIMPNTASDVSSSITCYAFDKKDYKHKKSVEKVISFLGDHIEIDESLMNAATVLGACGLAYVFRFIRAMVQGGVQIGFDSKSAEKLVLQTMIGAVNLLKENSSHPEQEIDKVATPKGCTIIGLNEMEHQGFSSSLIKGIELSFKSISK